ncbi:MAG: ribosomal RNA small subunit methyltransferase A, partial [Bacteroidales bacterium]|nr:ribosomal RNA small subunit methyltransferase A [Bacteroidales bacterium]
KKSLGQHFLTDENIARKIIGSLNPAIPLVLEIGPGKGVLSKYLLEDPRFDPWFVEIDRESVNYLKERYPAIRDRMIEEDFLKLDLGSLIPDLGSLINRQPSGIRHLASGIQILGNFPYNISSQILFQVLKHRDLVAEVTGIFQREVARRIAAPPGSKTYGILSVLLQAFYRIEYLFTVNESVFFPPPNVKSAVIRLVRNDVQSLDCDEQFWITVVKTAFNQRRKTLRNSLRKLTPPGFPDFSNPLFGLRPEQLTVSDFVALARMLHPVSSENN